MIGSSEGNWTFISKKVAKNFLVFFCPIRFFYWNNLIFSALFKVSSINSVEPFLYDDMSSMSSSTTLMYAGFRIKISLFLFSNFSSYWSYYFRILYQMFYVYYYPFQFNPICQPNIHVKDNPKLFISDYPSLIAPGKHSTSWSLITLLIS